MGKRIAIIGTRTPGAEAAELCRKVAAAFRDLGWELVTGNAEGIDGIARDVWNQRYPERVTLVLPWRGYNAAAVHPANRVVVFNGQRAWVESVKKYHPAAGSLSQGAVKLHARNYGIVELADAVVAFPNDGKEGGGTGQGIRVARALGKPLFVMPGDVGALREFYAAAAGRNGGAPGRSGAAGRIVTCRVGERVEADLKLQITRSSRGLEEGWVWEPLLAPPEDLFEDYLRWRARGEWPRRWDEYRRRFVVYMGARDVRLRLAELAQEVRAGKTVALACFCTDDRWCHRSLVAERLRLLADGVIAR